MDITITNSVLIFSFFFFCVASVQYQFGQKYLGRVSGFVGFLLLCLMWTLYGVGYILQSLTATFLLLVSVGGFLVCAHAARLTYTEWDRTMQLINITTLVLALSVPFQIFPDLELSLQEYFTLQTVSILEFFGYQPWISQYDGAMIQINFDNGGHLIVAPECVGVGAVALFAGLVLGVDTSLSKKLGGFLLVVSTVYVLNTLRMIFVGKAMGANWFGRHLDTADPLQMNYYIAEVLIGQTFVIIASLIGLYFLSKWIPDLSDFLAEFIDTFNIATG